MKKLGIPNAGDFASLPKWACVAFAARCARRIQQLNTGHSPTYPGKNLLDRLIDEATDAAEKAADDGIPPHDVLLGTRIAVVVDNFYRGDPVPAVSGHDAAISAWLAATGQYGGRMPSKCAFDAAESVVVAYGASAAPAIMDDYKLLVRAARENKWTDKSPVLSSFFALNSYFDLSVPLEVQNVVQIASVLQLRALEMAGDPTRLFALSPREFEELIAELFHGFGFDVELTQRTRDGGKDIVAVKHDFARVKYLVECKRLSPERSVGISVVQRLHGVTIAEGANKGILATTAHVTKPAKHYILTKSPWVLEAREFDGILEWLQLYQRLQLGKLSDSLRMPGL